MLDVDKYRRHMTDIQQGEIWETRPDTNARWRRVKVLNVTLDVVELQYLDGSGAADVATTVTTTQSAMLASTALFRRATGA
jgi:hypothetical protein